MSVLGISFLNEILSKQEFPRADEILNMLRRDVLQALSKKVENIDIQDGMDIALVIIDRKEMQIEFAGAFQPLILIHNGEMLEVPGDRMPIGSYIIDGQKFKNNIFKIVENDAIYLFSDGFVSQFGGEENRKFNSKTFRQLLLKINTKPMQEQKQILESTMVEYMRNHEQMDDMMVIGIRI